jgi:hypothetical protein
MEDPNLPKLPPSFSPAERRQQARERMAAFLKEKWNPPVICPICDSDSWTFGDVVDVPVRDPDTGDYPIPTYSLVPVFCDTCGYSIFFNAVSAGAVPSFFELQQQWEQWRGAAEETEEHWHSADEE